MTPLPLEICAQIDPSTHPLSNTHNFDQSELSFLSKISRIWQICLSLSVWELERFQFQGGSPSLPRSSLQTPVMGSRYALSISSAVALFISFRRLCAQASCCDRPVLIESSNPSAVTGADCGYGTREFIRRSPSTIRRQSTGTVSVDGPSVNFTTMIYCERKQNNILST